MHGFTELIHTALYSTLVAVSHNGSVSLVHYIAIAITQAIIRIFLACFILISILVRWRFYAIVPYHLQHFSAFILLCEVSNLQLHLFSYIFCFAKNAAVSAWFLQILVATPKNIAKVRIGKCSVKNESCLS